MKSDGIVCSFELDEIESRGVPLKEANVQACFQIINKKLPSLLDKVGVAPNNLQKTLSLEFTSEAYRLLEVINQLSEANISIDQELFDSILTAVKIPSLIEEMDDLSTTNDNDEIYEELLYASAYFGVLNIENIGTLNEFPEETLIKYFEKANPSNGKIPENAVKSLLQDVFDEVRATVTNRSSM